MARVLTILEIDHRIESTYMDDFGLIKVDANPIVLHRAPPSTSFGATHFEGPSI